MKEQTSDHFRNGKKIDARSDNVTTHFALATRKGRKEIGGMTSKEVVWFAFGDEEGVK